jgi:hypothetical protein
MPKAAPRSTSAHAVSQQKRDANFSVVELLLFLTLSIFPHLRSSEKKRSAGAGSLANRSLAAFPC